MRYFTLAWYQYLFSKPDDSGYCNWIRRLICRAKGHPCGPWYYNPGGLEPDMTCQDCGDEI